MNKIYLSVIIMKAFIFTLSGDSVIQSITITPSKRGGCFFNMLPDPKNPVGIAYKIDKSGNIKELYKTSGWYSPQVFISNNGTYLIRLNPLPFGEPTKNDLAIAFYKNGKLLNKYTILELIKDKSSIMKSVSHYYWSDRSSYELYSTKKVFKLKTLDNIIYEFKFETGKIIKSYPAKPEVIYIKNNFYLDFNDDGILDIRYSTIDSKTFILIDKTFHEVQHDRSANALYSKEKKSLDGKTKFIFKDSWIKE